MVSCVKEAWCRNGLGSNAGRSEQVKSMVMGLHTLILRRQIVQASAGADLW